MKPAAKTAQAAPEAQLQSFIEKFSPEHQALIRSVRKAVRKRLAGAHELVYDNYNFFVIGYSPTGRPTDSIISIAAGANGVGLAFPYCGARLSDPHHVLQGAGAHNRFVRLDSAKVLERPEVEELIAAAVGMSKPLPEGKGSVIIRSISAKQRPRRK